MSGAVGFKLTFNAAKGNFFDREKVQRAVDAGTKRVLSRFGAFVRQRAKTSIRKRKTISPPGGPPHSQGGQLRNGILFSYDPAGKSVVIGPVLLNGSRTSPTVPELHEFGGTVPGNGREVWFTNAVGRDAKGKFVSNGRKLVRLDGALVYPARPFMRPAFRAEIKGRLAAQLKGFVNKGAA